MWINNEMWIIVLRVENEYSSRLQEWMVQIRFEKKKLLNVS